MAKAKVARLEIAPTPGKSDMLRLLDKLRAGVERGAVFGLMVTAIEADTLFTNYHVGDISPTNRLGYLMFQVHDLLHATSAALHRSFGAIGREGSGSTFSTRSGNVGSYPESNRNSRHACRSSMVIHRW